MEENKNKVLDYEEDIWFEDEDKDPKLVEVSEKTRLLLEASCVCSLSNTNCIKMRSCFPLPKVLTTKTPHLDSFMKTEISSTTKATDRDLAKIQMFILDTLAPLTSVIEHDNQGDSLLHQEVLTAIRTAVQLIGNTNH